MKPPISCRNQQTKNSRRVYNNTVAVRLFSSEAIAADRAHWPQKVWKSNFDEAVFSEGSVAFWVFGSVALSEEKLLPPCRLARTVFSTKFVGQREHIVTANWSNSWSLHQLNNPTTHLAAETHDDFDELLGPRCKNFMLRAQQIVSNCEVSCEANTFGRKKNGDILSWVGRPRCQSSTLLVFDRPFLLGGLCAGTCPVFESLGTDNLSRVSTHIWMVVLVGYSFPEITGGSSE